LRWCYLHTLRNDQPHAYVFGALAVLTAATIFAAYIKALPNWTQNGDQKILEDTLPHSELVSSIAANWVHDVPPTHHRTVPAKQFEDAVRNYWAHVSRSGVFFDSVEHRSTDLAVATYYTQIKYRKEASPDTASVIVNVVERLCATSNEPRFEFVLGPDGSFTIRHISAKSDGDVSSERAEMRSPQLVH
jgi:hypothetical protein